MAGAYRFQRMNGLETMVELAGQNVVLSYGGIDSEYEALHRRAIVVNRSHRARMRFVGEKAADVLTGLVTNDVTSLLVGQGQYAAALTAKGKVVADLRILRLDDSFLTDASARSRDGWFNIVRKYVNPRLAKYIDESAAIQSIGVFGVQARYVVEQMTGIGHSALSLLVPYALATIAVDGGLMIVMHSPELGVEGYELLFPAERYSSTWDAAIAARATPGGLGVWEVARVEAGRPEWGIDMDESTIAQEANLEQLDAISFTKGCYTGQEVVARVHFRGHVNRALRGVRAAGTTMIPTRASLFDATGKAVGDVRTSVVSPRHGAIALAMLRREIENGTQLVVRWSADPAGDAPAGESTVDVVPLPFATQ
jgi:folate-binding protein YgfZ